MRIGQKLIHAYTLELCDYRPIEAAMDVSISAITNKVLLATGMMHTAIKSASKQPYC
jgi:hypothetical protein